MKFGYPMRILSSLFLALLLLLVFFYPVLIGQQRLPQVGAPPSAGTPPTVDRVPRVGKLPQVGRLPGSKPPEPEVLPTEEEKEEEEVAEEKVEEEEEVVKETIQPKKMMEQAVEIEAESPVVEPMEVLPESPSEPAAPVSTEE